MITSPLGEGRRSWPSWGRPSCKYQCRAWWRRVQAPWHLRPWVSPAGRWRLSRTPAPPWRTCRGRRGWWPGRGRRRRLWWYERRVPPDPRRLKLKINLRANSENCWKTGKIARGARIKRIANIGLSFPISYSLPRNPSIFLRWPCQSKLIKLLIPPIKNLALS